MKTDPASSIKPWHKLEYILIFLTIIILQYHVFIPYIVKRDSFIFNRVYSSLILEEIPVTLIIDIGLYIAIIIFVHVVIALFAWFVSRVLRYTGKFAIQDADAIGLMSFMAVWSMILIKNSIDYPRSEFAYPNFEILYFFTPAFIYYCSLAITIIALLIIIYGLTVFLKNRTSRLQKSVIVTASCIVLGLVLIIDQESIHANSRMPADEPNIIFIGVDSLMLEFLDRSNEENIMPFIRDYTQDAVVFDNSFTPQARTYPSLMSVLSGNFPLTSNARINLINPDYIDKSNLISNTLKQWGYTTMFATDEVRFSNIDKTYGFDYMLSPEIGAGDFIMDAIADMPVVNLVRNREFARYILPYHYINRAMDNAYEPESFNNALKRQLLEVSEKPAFLKIHFCLPHWPYMWKYKARSDIPFTPSHRTEYFFPILKSALNRVDKQVETLFKDLEELGFLDNTIVVLFSDHGETIGRHKDLPYEIIGDENSKELTKKTYGHGINLLASNQYRILLTFKRYGDTGYQRNRIDQLAGTVDIFPTIMDLLGYPRQSDKDGISLAPWINGNNVSTVKRYFPMETGFFIPALKKINPTVRELFKQGIGYYKVRKDGRIVVSEDMEEKILLGKQLGIRTNEAILATDTTSEDIVNLYFAYEKGDRIIQLKNDNFAIDCNEDCMELLGEFRSFYGKEAVDRLVSALGKGFISGDLY